MCTKQVEHDPIFEAVCGHEHGASAVFHPLCLMKWREDRDLAFRRAREYAAELQAREYGDGESA